MFLLGRRMTATEAAHYGLVNKVVPKEQLMDAAREWAASIAWSAPLAMQSVKEVQREIECVPLEKHFIKCVLIQCQYIEDAPVVRCQRRRCRIRRKT